MDNSEILERIKRRGVYIVSDNWILTPQEHLMIGSTPPYRDRNPFIPVKLSVPVDKSTVEYVVNARIEQGVIVSPVASIHFGIEEPIRHSAVIKLGGIDTATLEVEDPEPELIAIYNEESGNFITDPEVLSKYSLTEEGRKKYSLEASPLVVGFRERNL